MTGTVEIPFAIDQTVWHVGSGRREEWVPCPDCAGERRHHVRLGNGEEITIWCETCRRAGETPSGRLLVWIGEHKPTEFVCRRVSIEWDGRVRYSEKPRDDESSLTRYVGAEDLFDSFEACVVACGRRNRDRKQEEDDRIRRRAASGKETIPHTVHYWRRQIRQHRQNLEYAERELQILKEKKDKHE